MPGVDIKKDDNVIVMSGKDRGHTGRVVHVMPREGRIMVEGAARAKKHTQTRGKRSTGGQHQNRYAPAGHGPQERAPSKQPS